MSFYTKFQDVETVVTSSTTANLMGASDPVLIYSGVLKRPSQSTVGSVNAFTAVSTSSSTGTNLPNSGSIFLTSVSSANWILSDPAQKGQEVTIFSSSSTSTGSSISPVSATITSTDGTAGAATNIVFKSNPANIFLTSVSTNQWFVMSRSSNVLCT